MSSGAHVSELRAPRLPRRAWLATLTPASTTSPWLQAWAGRRFTANSTPGRPWSRGVAERAIASSEAELGSVDLTGDPAAVLTRLLTASWHLTHRFGALVVAAEKSLPQETLRDAHKAPIKRVRTILRRGRREGYFRTDVRPDCSCQAAVALQSRRQLRVDRE